MNTPIKKRLLRTALFSLIALAIGMGIGLFQVSNDTARVSQKSSRSISMAGVQVGGPFELVDHHGETVTEATYQDQFKLIFFGFTSCPMVCPTALQKITQTFNILSDNAEEIQPLFITTDPQRDTIDVMREYISSFHPQLVGLTGNAAQIDKILQDYRVYARKVEDPKLSDYTMDHSSFIYLMSPKDELLAIYRSEDDADFIAQDIGTRLN